VATVVVVEATAVVEEDTAVEGEEDTVVDTEAEEVTMAATLADTVVAVTEVGLRTQQPPQPSVNKADFAGGDRMSNLGAGLQDINWSSTQLTKFEKK
jgi:hypothetical protein